MNTNEIRRIAAALANLADEIDNTGNERDGIVAIENVANNLDRQINYAYSEMRRAG